MESEKKRLSTRPGFRRRLLLIVTACVLFNVRFTDCYEVGQIGNDIIASAGGPDITGGSATFLLKDPFPQAGVLFAFSAYFRNRNPLQFQIWRPSSSISKNNFTLLAQLEITPSIGGNAELVYIVSQLTEKCVRVQPGDRLGVYFANSTSSLVHTFNPFDTNTQILVNYMDGTPQLIGINETLTFNLRVYPYDFSLIAYYYLENETSVDSSSVTLDCPKYQLIQGDPKPSTPTTPIPTGVPGATGLRGPKGVSGAIGLEGPIGSTGNIGPTGSTGSTGVKGQLGDTGSTGNMGAYGNVGNTGSIGKPGTVGATGYIGPEGPMGDIGLPGSIVYMNETQNMTEEADKLSSMDGGSDQWKSEAYMKGCIIWLAIASFLLIILFIAVVIITCCYRSLCKQVEDISSRVDLYGMSNTMTTNQTLPRFKAGTVKSQKDLDIDEDLRDMREETFTNYEVDTMEKYATQKLKDFTLEKNY